MARVNFYQSNVSSGELSPQLFGRTDVAKYQNGVETLENFIVKNFGGAFRRPGTYYVNEVKDSSKATRLIPFQFSTTQAYIIEVGNLYMRFYMNDGLIEIGGVPGAGAYEIATPYLEADLFDLQFAQDADTMYIVHKDYPPAKLTRTAHWTWTLTEIDYSTAPNRAPMMDTNSETTTITPSADTGAGITLTASVAIFDETHIDSIWRIKSGWVKITNVVAGGLKTAATANVLYSGNLATGPAATTDWAEGAWSDYRGYPSTVCFFEERLIYAGSDDEPQRLWGSTIGEYDNFDQTGTVADDDAFSYTIASQQVNAIQWLIPTKVLALGTIGGNFVATTGSSNEPISPTNIQIKPETSYGSALLIPKRIGHYVYYVQRDYRTVRELSYDYASDAFVSLDMTLLAEHITESGIHDLDYQESPDNILWMVREDGEIATLTRQIDQQIIGWSRQILGGSFGGGQAVVESVATIPNDEEDEVWVVVKRTIDGSTQRYVEYFKPFRMPDEQEDCFYVDSGLTLDTPIDITNITKADPGVVTTDGAHGLSNGDIVRLTVVKGMTEVNKKYFKVANKNASDFELTDMNGNDVDTTDYTAYVSGGEIRKCVNSISGLDHLEGETVSVCVDGGAHPDRVVSSGAITLDDYYSHVHVGLGYTSKIKGLRIEAGSAIGSGQGLLGRIMKTTLRLYRTLGAKIGTSDTSMDDVYFRDSGMSMNEAVPLFTGDKTLTFPQGYKRNPVWEVEQLQPLPLNVLAVISYYSQEDI